MVTPYPAGDLERTYQRSRKRTGNAHNSRTHLIHRRFEMAFQMGVHHTAPPHTLFYLAKIVHRNGNMLRIAGEAEVGIDIVAYPQRNIIDDFACPTLRLNRQRTLQYLDELIRLFSAVFAQDIQRNLHGEVTLMDIKPLLLQKSRKVHRGRIRAVRLKERRSEQKQTVPGHRMHLIRKERRRGRISDSHPL